MSDYLPLAIKYRPMKFSDVVGQEVAKKVLIGMLKSKRIGFSYLFGGQRGVGKTTCARIFAKALNCKSPGGVEPCCECKSCIDIARSRAADVVEHDSASSGSVAAIRSIREASHFCTLGGGFRVWILDEVHCTSPEGFGALLKIMEEPPPRVVFLLCTTELTEVPDTILSRCFQIPFRGVTTTDVVSRLRDIADKEELLVGDDVLELLAVKGSGAIRDSLTLLDQLIAMHGRDLKNADVLSSVGVGTEHHVGELLISVADRNPKAVITEFRKMWKLLPDSREFIRMVADCFRDVEFVVQGMADEVKETRRRQAEILAAKLDLEIREKLLERTSMLERAFLNTRLNPQILIEMWLMSLVAKEQRQKVVDTLAVSKFWDELG